jgi:fatty acid desaturase
METENPQQPNQPNQEGGHYNPYQMPVDTSVMTVGDWILTFLITAIPIVGFVMLFIWAFGNDTNQNKANYAKATLLWMLIGIALGLLVMIMFWGALMALVMGSQ